jgi:sugar phosphate isomerase/epimerase
MQTVAGVISRRELLLGTCAGALCAVASAERRIPVALQLFSVRNQCKADLPGTLARVKEIGFEGVELAGDYGHTAQEFRRFLDDQGLVCCAAHVSLTQLQAPKYQATVDFLHGVGAKRAVVPGLPGNYTQDLTGWRGAATLFVELSGQLRRDGLELGYHNHAIEFKASGGERPLDVFLRSAPGIFFELDLGGAGYGGANPVEVLETYRRRTRMIHVKDYTAAKPDLMIGTGSMDWSGLARDAQSAAVDWYVVEHGSTSGPDLADIAQSYEQFTRVLKA